MVLIWVGCFRTEWTGFEGLRAALVPSAKAGISTISFSYSNAKRIDGVDRMLKMHVRSLGL
jgi:hypothetical protein